MSDDILSQEERDALLESVKSGDVPASSAQRTYSDEALPYDFADRDGRQIRDLSRLEVISELFIEQLQEPLQRIFRTEATVVAQPSRSQSLDEALALLNVPSFIAVCKGKPLAGPLFVILESKLLWLMVDRYFGGEGRDFEAPPNKHFTAVEERLATTIVGAVLSALKLAWEDVLDVDFSIEETEHNPDYLTVPITNEPIASLSYEIGFDSVSGIAHVLYPHETLKPLRAKLTRQPAIGREAVDSEWYDQLSDLVRDAEVSLSARLGDLQLSLRELLTLEPGHVIPIRAPDEVVMSLQGVRLFEGKLGIHEGHNAVRVRKSRLDQA